MIILNIDMPERCGECSLRASDDFRDDFCIVNGRWSDDGRPDDCPIVELVTCKDCISRADAISSAKCIIKSPSEVPKTVTILRMLQELPSVTLTRKKGKWIYKKVRYEKVPCCSKCGLDSGTYYEFSFCPNCGAEMESEG